MKYEKCDERKEADVINRAMVATYTTKKTQEGASEFEVGVKKQEISTDEIVHSIRPHWVRVKVSHYARSTNRNTEAKKCSRCLLLAVKM